jgi:hypothetical protein
VVLFEAGTGVSGRCESGFERVSETSWGGVLPEGGIDMRKQQLQQMRWLAVVSAGFLLLIFVSLSARA